MTTQTIATTSPKYTPKSAFHPQSGFVETEHGPVDSRAFYRSINSRKGISKVAEALTTISTESGISPQRRGLILALLDLSKGSPDPFKVCNFTLGKRLYPFDSTASPEVQRERRKSLERQTRRELKKLTEEQIASGLTLVQIKEGRQVIGRDGFTTNIPNEFSLESLLELLQNTFAEFKTQTGPDRMRTAARIAIERTGAQMKIPPKLTDRREPDLVALSEKQTLTWAEKYIKASGDKRTASERLAEKILEIGRTGGEDTCVRNIMAFAAEIMVQPEESGVLVSSESQGGTPLPNAGQDFPAYLKLSDAAPSVEEELPAELEPQACAAHAPPCDSFIGESDARRALDAFLSVESCPDQVIFKDDETKAKEAEQKVSLKHFTDEVEQMIDDARQGGVSFIARMRGPVLQVDDCDEETVRLLQPRSFLVVETSKRNYQCWLAFADEEDKAAARERLMRGLREILPGTQANSGSGGAMRWPASFNFKPNRRDANGDPWLIRIAHVEEGRVVTPSELDDAGLLALPPVEAQSDSAARPSSNGWPDYQIALSGATPKSDGAPDESNADARFVTSAITQFGHSDHRQIAAKLREVSPHARDNEPESYASKTVARVADHLKTKCGIAWA